MDFEVWDSRSGNMLLSTPDLPEALTWAFNFWLREGLEAVDALTVGDEDDRWNLSGVELRNLLQRLMWPSESPWVTSANDRVVDVPAPGLSLVA
jgi:hypothetical protein